jgi:fructose-1,6-bisphosphatase/inositol monophosphatase family enzyme
MTTQALSQAVAASRLSKNDKGVLRRLFSAMRDAFLFGSATYDAASLADGAGATSTITVTGAALGDFAVVSAGVDLAGVTCTAYVSAANTVSFRLQNESGGVVDLASTTFRAMVIKRDHFDGTAILGLTA